MPILKKKTIRAELIERQLQLTKADLEELRTSRDKLQEEGKDNEFTQGLIEGKVTEIQTLKFLLTCAE